MNKIDFKKEYKNLFHPPVNKVVTVDVPEMDFLMIDGKGDPNKSESFQDAVEALYSASYTLKFALKHSGRAAVQDYVVPPLEGLWWSDDLSQFSVQKKDQWKWTLMIMQPCFVTSEDVTAAIAEVSQKKKLKSLVDLRFNKFLEGQSVQIMHMGPFAAEAPSIEKLHCFIKDNGFSIYGKHHEIYLSDPRKTDPDKMKTIIRQPFR